MNKNRKRLTKLLIPMLALSAINTNAVGNVKVRSTSFSKKRSQYRLRKLDEINPGGLTLWNDDAKEKERRAHVVQYSGPALNEFLQDFELLETKRFEGNDSYGVDGVVIENRKKQRVFAGNVGTVTKCRRKKDGKIFAVKCEVNPITTKIQRETNANVHEYDNNNENRFYKDVEKWWKDKKWAVKCHAKYNDGFATYTVTDWVEGVTLNQWIRKLRLYKTASAKLAQMFKQYNEIINDLSKQKKINRGMHVDNIMVVKDDTNKCGFQIKLVDNGRYETMSDEREREERNARQIMNIMNHPTLIPLWRALKNGHDNVDQTSYTIKGTIHKKNSYYQSYADGYLWFKEVLNNIGAVWSTRGDRIMNDDSKDKSSENRNQLTTNLQSLSKCLEY